MFDIGVDIFQELLVERGLIPREIAEATRKVRDEPDRAEFVQPYFEAAFEGQYEAFRAALVDARDYMGAALAETWKRLQADDFSYRDVALTLIEVDAMMSGGRFKRAFIESFDWRDIGRATVGPRLKPPGPHSHTHSARTLLPGIRDRLPTMSYRERALMAGIAR
jgi:hypothetical protein